MAIYFARIPRIINDYASPIGIRYVSMLLSIIGIRLVERDLMAAICECAKNATVVSSGSIPIGGDETGPPKGNLHACTSSDKALSSGSVAQGWCIA
jgi:hypothetical protein